MKTSKRMLAVLVLTVLTALMMTVSVSAAGEVPGSGTGFDVVTRPIVDLINSLMTPLLAIVGAVGSLYCVILGVKFAKAEEPQDREKAKSALKNAVIGFVLIFVLLLALKLLMPIMTNWVSNNGTFTA